MPDAPRDAKFVSRLGTGGSVTLGRADRVRWFMRVALFRPLLACELRAFLSVTGLKAWQVGDCAVNHPKFVDLLPAGSSPRLRTIDCLRVWMHGKLRPEELRAVLVAVAMDPGVGAGMGSNVVFFSE